MTESRRERIEHIRRLQPSRVEDMFELRDAILCDRNASVRAVALLRLKGPAARACLPYVREAAVDRAPTVREAAFAVLARARDTESLNRAEAACRYDRSFRVRRAATLFAARSCGAAGQNVLRLAAADPFWRVSVVARRELARLGMELELDAPPEPPFTPFEGGDPDPAVVAARLARAVEPLELRGLLAALGHSHESLRRFAVKTIAASGSLDVLIEATRWFDDERFAYGPEAAQATLARAGTLGNDAARAVLQCESASSGALSWALSATPQALDWRQLEALAVHADSRVRRAAVARLPEVAPDRDALFSLMRQLLSDADGLVREHAAFWLARTKSRDARAALLELDPSEQLTPVRALLVELQADLHHFDGLRSLASDAHVAVRAPALRALSEARCLSSGELDAAEADPDPWVRAAVVAQERAFKGLADASSLVRRAALDIAEDDVRTHWALHDGFRDVEPSMRAEAARIAAHDASDAAALALLALARDGDFGVRGFAVETLYDRLPQLRALLTAGTPTADQRVALYTALRLGGERDLPDDVDPNVAAHIALLQDVESGGVSRVPVQRVVAAETKRELPTGPRRPLGNSGIVVGPFGLSGAYDLRRRDFALARERGVNLYFWEPTHFELARFLRTREGRDSIVVAGTYEADPNLIEKDVRRVLRALRRDSIDVFLAFWTRSSTRLDEIAESFEALQRRGLIRARGISTHDRSLACEASARGLEVVMVRHNAAHRGAEAHVFPDCVRRGTGVLTFSNLCYGRMLQRTPVRLSAPVTAPDCYRYSLSQPGVSACVAAPRRYRELIENLEVLSTPELESGRARELREHGDHVYERSKGWRVESAPPQEQRVPLLEPAHFEATAMHP